MPLIFSGSARNFVKKPLSSPWPFSLRRCCHLSNVPLFFLLRQKNRSALISASPTKPPITPPAIGATLVEPFGGSVKPLPWSADPVSGDIIPADPAAGIPVSVGRARTGCVSEEELSGNADCTGADIEAADDGASGAIVEASCATDDAAGTSAKTELVGGTAAEIASELAGARVADGDGAGVGVGVGAGLAVDSTDGVSRTSGTGAGTAAAGTCGEMFARSDDCAAVEETALLVPIVVEAASVDVACCCCCCCVDSVEVVDEGGGGGGGGGGAEDEAAALL